jgi:hypothetical protein
VGGVGGFEKTSRKSENGLFELALLRNTPKRDKTKNRGETKMIYFTPKNEKDFGLSLSRNAQKRTNKHK